jgi:hypothetical protein
MSSLTLCDALADLEAPSVSSGLRMCLQFLPVVGSHHNRPGPVLSFMLSALQPELEDRGPADLRHFQRLCPQVLAWQQGS